ncbi:MAG: molybdopterin-dependent oxidoreductase, partial [Burkholderiales bacterium]|nr:molybdopterin-dependent oxidoreductase [Burkholderiales bacterium]
QAQPTKYPAGFFHIFTGSYDYPAAYCKVTAVYTNKAPGGVAYACSFRITEASYAIERIVDCLAAELQMDPAELRLKNLLRPEQFPYTTPTGWEYDSGEYEKTMIMRPGAAAPAYGTTTQSLNPGLHAPANHLGAAGAAVTPASIKVLNGAAAGREVVLTKVVTTVGKPGVQVASITRRPNGYAFSHVEGTARPSVNGVPLVGDSVPLRNGDVIELAGTQMQFIHH